MKSILRYFKATVFLLGSVLLCLLLITGQVGGLSVTQTTTYSWKNMNNSDPGRLLVHSMAFDIAADKLIMFSGRAHNGILSNSTWSYDVASNSWTERNPATHPIARQWAHMDYNSEDELSVVFGGGGKNGLALDDLWSYDYDTNTWTELPAHPETGLIFPKFTYVEPMNAIFLASGQNPLSTAYGTSWWYFFDNSSWVKVNPVEDRVNATFNIPVSYHPPTNSILQFGYGRIYEYSIDENTWTTTTQSGDGTKAVATNPIYDPITGLFIRYGGYNIEDDRLIDETWSYNHNTSTWKQLQLSPKPAARGVIGNFAYDPNSEVAILYGGGDAKYYNDTWILDITHPVTTPSSSPTADNEDGLPLALIPVMVVPVLLAVLRKFRK